MNYQQTLDYLFSCLPMYHRIGAAAYKADLGNTLALCELTGNPHLSFPTLHIAGTNGKGSVSHMLSAILQRAGLKTGLYTSPHLRDFRERIRVDGMMIGEHQVIEFVGRYRDAFETIQPSFFEMTVALAFDHFRKEGVDVAVVEVGLGGRLDSTNVITPLVSVITNVSFDHMQLLGNTLPLIAAEKGGIIKQGVPVIVGESHPETDDVFRSMAKATGSQIIWADRHYRTIHVEKAKTPPLGLTMDILKDGSLWMEHLHTPLAGNYQLKNILTVIATCQSPGLRQYNIGREHIAEGIAEVERLTGLAGRWQVLGRDPLTICDTGHNEAGIREVMAQIKDTPHEDLHVVFGVVNDKSLETILTLLPKNARYYFCKANIPRGLDAGELQVMAAAAGLKGEVCSSVANALQTARSRADSKDLVFVGGSTFVVAEVV